MAKSSQTFRKRQRELKVREKAQLKRERREQRRSEKKASLGSPLSEPSILAADTADFEPATDVSSETETLASAEKA